MRKGGFTIVELLVVISIISLIGSVVFVQLSRARERARDAEREEEIKTLQNALALYVVNAQNFPIWSGVLTGSDPVSTTLINAGALPQVPMDPLNAGDFLYAYNSADGSTYILTYYLETNSIPGKSAGTQTAGP